MAGVLTLAEKRNAKAEAPVPATLLGKLVKTCRYAMAKSYPELGPIAPPKMRH